MLRTKFRKYLAVRNYLVRTSVRSINMLRWLTALDERALRHQAVSPCVCDNVKTCGCWYTSIHTLSLSHTHTHTHTRSQTHLHTHTPAGQTQDFEKDGGCVRVFNVYTHTLSRAHTHTHAHKHTHTHVRLQVCRRILETRRQCMLMRWLGKMSTARCCMKCLTCHTCCIYVLARNTCCIHESMCCTYISVCCILIFYV